MKANAPVDANPVDNTTYTANAAFGSGSQLGSGNYTVFNGVGNNVTVTNLIGGSTYHIAVFEYNDLGGVNKLYLTINPARESFVTSSLPVTLIDFAAKEVNNNVLLQWSTAQEFNSARFEVERGSNGNQYEKIGFVNAAGNSSSRREYSFNDNTIIEGNYYYRLKQVDIDGRFVYSKVVSIAMKDKNIFRLLENPAQNELRLVVNRNAQQQFTISIFDMGGKLMKQQTMKNQPIATVDISQLNAGMYLVQLVAGNNIIRLKFMKTN